MVYYETLKNAHILPQGGITEHIQPFLMFLLPTGSSTGELTYVSQKSLLIPFTLAWSGYALESDMDTPT